MKVTYIGDEKFITLYGEHFQNGKAVDVADDHPYAFKFAANPTFTVTGGKPEVSEEKKALFAEAESLGLEPRANASVEALQKMIDDKRLEEADLANRITEAKKG